MISEVASTLRRLQITKRNSVSLSASQTSMRVHNNIRKVSIVPSGGLPTLLGPQSTRDWGQHVVCGALQKAAQWVGSTYTSEIVDMRPARDLHMWFHLLAQTLDSRRRRLRTWTAGCALLALRRWGCKRLRLLHRALLLLLWLWLVRHCEMTGGNGLACAMVCVLRRKEA